MSKSNLTVVMDGDEARLWRSLSKIVTQQGKMEQGFGKVKQSGVGVDRVLKNVFSVSRIAGWAAGLGSVLGALKLITAELQQHLQLQEKSAATQMTVHATRQDVIRNMPGASKQQIAAVLASTTKLAKETNVKEQYINAAMASALSASSGNVSASQSAVRQAALFLGDRPEAIGDFAGSLLDISKVTGTKDARINQGLLSYVGGLSRVTDPRKQAMYIPRAMINQMAYGSTAEGAAALYAAISTASGDIMGATSATGSVAVAEQLRDYRARGVKKDVWAGMTTSERIQHLQDAPIDAKRFMESASFEKTVAGAVEQMLADPLSEAATTYRSNLTAIPNQKRLGAIADMAIANRSIDPLAATAEMARAYETATEASYSGNIIDAQGHVHRQGLVEFMRSHGKGALSEKFMQAKFEASSQFGTAGPGQAAIGILQAHLENLEHPTQTRLIKAGPEFVPRETSRAPTEEEQRYAQETRDLINALKEVVVTLKENTASQRGPTLGKPNVEPQ